MTQLAVKFCKRCGQFYTPKGYEGDCSKACFEKRRRQTKEGK